MYFLLITNPRAMKAYSSTAFKKRNPSETYEFIYFTPQPYWTFSESL